MVGVVSPGGPGAFHPHPTKEHLMSLIVTDTHEGTLTLTSDASGTAATVLLPIR